MLKLFYVILFYKVKEGACKKGRVESARLTKYTVKNAFLKKQRKIIGNTKKKSKKEWNSTQSTLLIIELILIRFFIKIKIFLIKSISKFFFLSFILSNEL